MTTATVLLKSGEEVQVSLEELENYLYTNAANILPRLCTWRGKRREQEVTSPTVFINNK